MMKGKFVFAAIFFAIPWAVFGQNAAPDLTIGLNDVRIEQHIDGGYHLFIRKKQDIRSVLITESTKDPTMHENNYAYRTPTKNAINGDEKRVLNGYFLPPEYHIYSLIDSTPQPDRQFGQAFEIYIPNILNYGYSNTRHGEVYVHDGTYLNLRAFLYPYADYRGPFKDNPFVVRVTQKPQPGPPADNYMKDTITAFTNIVEDGGDLIYSTGQDDVLKKIKEILDKEKGKSLDFVLCLDTTGSMGDDIAPMQKHLVELLQNEMKDFKSFRIGMVLYKDYEDVYLNKVIPFTADMAVLQTSLNAIRSGGGRDIPEAVDEALYAAATSPNLPWAAESRVLVLIGDAPPHPLPRGKITRAMVNQAVAAKGIKLSAIVLPQ